METETENDDERRGDEVEEIEETGASERKATPENAFESRSWEPEGKRGTTDTATAPETTQDSDEELLIRVVGDNINNPPDRD
ncbi:hypothetical protein N7486_005320 [Penicillium sp. IBT 16267x]|nr:hypothetical protein N7486_005320 [Penicillium sp. IBT 16267x]